MEPGELIARGSIWIALLLYILGEFGRLRWRGSGGDGGVPRWLSTAGCGLYVVHVASAFGVFHGWSHAAAYEFTAQQTETLVGWDWGGGLFVNHAFTAVWLVELAAWWRSPARYRRRARWIDLAVRLFFAFMILNGAVVFVSGPQRWLGVVLVAVLLRGFGRFRR